VRLWQGHVGFGRKMEEEIDDPVALSSHEKL